MEYGLHHNPLQSHIIIVNLRNTCISEYLLHSNFLESIENIQNAGTFSK